MPSSRSRSLTGVVAVAAALTMLFAAFASAYIVRRGLGGDWTALAIPWIMWVSPVALILARGRLAIPFAIAAVAAIAESCREQTAIGPAAAFFFLFGAAFVLCILGGIAARAVRIYWIFLAGLWSWLLLFLEVWR